MNPNDLIGKNIFISGYSRNHLFRIDNWDLTAGMYICTDLLSADTGVTECYWSEYKIRMLFQGDRTAFRSIKIISEDEVEEYRRNQIVRKIMEE